MPTIMLFVDAAVRTERMNDVREVVAAREETASVTPSPLLRVQLHYSRALLAQDDDPERCYRETLAQDLLRSPWVRARIELAFGPWLRRQRRVVECRAYLRSACDTFDVIGASPWAEQARTELRAGGERRGGDGPAIGEVLSPQELESTRLAAEALHTSRRQLAARIGSSLARVAVAV